MNFAALFFALVAIGLTGCVFASEDSVDDPSSYELDEVKAVVENDEEQRCVPTKLCDRFEEYRCCGPCYQLSCRGSVISCDSRCYADCFCEKGFVREYPGGVCIPNLFCPLVSLPTFSDDDDDEDI